MSALRIVLAITALAISYGIAHDQVTVRIAPEYFTVLHPKIIESTSPTMLAFAWGFAATWWMGAGLGALVAVACRAGRRPKFALRDVSRLLVVIVCLLPIAAVAGGLAGRVLGDTDVFVPFAADTRIAPDRRLDVTTVFSAHVAVEFAGAAALVGLAVHSWRLRGLLAARNRADLRRERS
ncbi:MAG: hypothetical protein ACO3QC_04660 [Phycisphaerales bacterium]